MLQENLEIKRNLWGFFYQASYCFGSFFQNWFFWKVESFHQLLMQETDLTKLPVDIFRTSLITDIDNAELDNKELRFEEVANKGKIRNNIFWCFTL